MLRRPLRSLLYTGLACFLLTGLAPGEAQAKRKRRPSAAAAGDQPPPEAPDASPAPPPEAPPPSRAASEPGRPAPVHASPSASSWTASNNNDKAGRFMANFKIGPALAAYNGGHSGAIVLDVGWSVLPNNNAYLLFPLQFQFLSGGGAVIIPVGFQYDIAMPVKNLYIYPRGSLGYAAFIASGGGDEFGGGGTSASHFGVLIPEFGVKYILNGRWNFGGEPFSLPIFFNSGGAAVYYRILLSAGANF